MPSSAGRRINFQTKIAVTTSATFLVLLSLTLFWLYRLASNELIKEMGQGLITMTSTGAVDIDGDEFARLTRPEQMASPAYKRIQDRLRRLRTANGHIRLRFVYTMAPTEKPGIWLYVVDAEDEHSPDFSALGAVEDFNYNPIWKKPLDRPIAEDKLRYYEGWGYLISASAPIRDRAGRSVGILSVDASAQNIAETLRAFRWRAVLCLSCGLLLCVIVSVLLSWGLTRPLPALIAGTRAVAQGDFDHRIDLTRNDEMGDLAQAFNQMAQGLRERELYRRQFGRYVSGQIAEKTLAGPENEFWESEKRRATILFSDMRGFTPMAQRIPPEETVARLNEYLAFMIDTIVEHGGSLDKFVGDSFMAVFGAPKSTGNDEERAVKAALAIQAKAAKLSQKWRLQGFPEFKVCIGIHTGDIKVGSPNSTGQGQYSALGDAVDMAARLESLNREFKTQILLSGETLKVLGAKVQTRLAGTVALPGKAPLEAYEVLGMK